MMVELLSGRTPDHFSLLNKDKLRVYHYKREGEATVKTPFGDVATVIYSSQADYSPRITRFWCAPDRGSRPDACRAEKGQRRAVDHGDQEFQPQVSQREVRPSAT